MDTAIVERIRQKYRLLASVMDERMRREWAGAEAAALGWGGVTAVARATGLARNTVAAGIAELRYRQAHPRDDGEGRPDRAAARPIRASPSPLGFGVPVLGASR